MISIISIPCHPSIWALEATESVRWGLQLELPTLQFSADFLQDLGTLAGTHFHHTDQDLHLVPFSLFRSIADKTRLVVAAVV